MRILRPLVQGLLLRSMVSGIYANLFETGMEDHHNVADLFHQVRTHGKWGCGNMVPSLYNKVPMSSARFWFQQVSPTMVLLVRSYRCFACHRHFGGICSPQLSIWEDVITIGMVMSTFCMCFACKGHFDEICSPLNERWDFVTIDMVTFGFRDDCIEIQAGTMDV